MCHVFVVGVFMAVACEFNRLNTYINDINNPSNPNHPNNSNNSASNEVYDENEERKYINDFELKVQQSSLITS